MLANNARRMFSAKGATSPSVNLLVSYCFLFCVIVVTSLAYKGFLSTLMNKIRSIVIAAYEWMT